MLEGRRKMEDVTSRPTLRLSSCTLLRGFSLTLHNPHILMYIVCYLNIHYDVTSLSNTMTHVLPSML